MLNDNGGWLVSQRYIFDPELYLFRNKNWNPKLLISEDHTSNFLASIGSHQLGLAQDMAFHGSFQGGFGCAGR